MFLPVKSLHGPVAVDIGAGGVRAVQMERRGSSLVIRHWAHVSTPGAPSAERAPDAPACSEHAQPRPVAAVHTLPPTLDRDLFVGNEVVVAINPPDVECTPLRVPDNLLKLERNTLINAIRHEVSRNINLPIDGVETDIWRLVPGHRDSPNLMVAAARRETIARILAWVNSQKLICRRIDVGPLAALRVCARMPHPPAEDHLWGVLDVGRSAIRLYIGLGETPVYVRCMSRSGEEMTRRIGEELGVSPKVAESYKCHYGVQAAANGELVAAHAGGPGSGGHYRPLTSGDDAVDSHRMAGILLSVLRPIIRGIGEEIQRSFRYAMGLYLDRPIAGLWLVGQGANMQGLAETLSPMLGIHVHRLSTAMLPSNIVAPHNMGDDVVPQLATCLGLSLGEMCP